MKLALVILLVCAVLALTEKRHISDPVTILTPRDSPNPEKIVSEKQLSRNKQLRVPRSIVHDHHQGANRTCDYVKDLESFLPPRYQARDDGKHFHLLLSINDNQLAFAINWLALAFELKYLPSHRVLIHFSCHGEATHDFIEKHLLSKCEKQPVRHQFDDESEWRHTIKDRLATFLDIVDKLDDTDSGAMSFDIDAPWIRDMVSVFDYYSASDKHSYDVISQGVMLDRPNQPEHDGKVLVNFGGIFIKSSKAGKAVAKHARIALDSKDKKLDFDWPDQDYITYAMLDQGKATQKALHSLEHLAKDSSHYNDHCVEHPNTCTHVSTGVDGKFNLDNDTDGTYMFLPGAIAPNKCEHICSGATVLFQHCGMSTCLDEKNNYGCLEIPEFVLHSHEVAKVLAFKPAKLDFKPAAFGTFDSRTLEYQTKTIRKFVSIKRLINFCLVYSSICRPNSDGNGIINLS
jgi:hypothetical protein